MPPVIINRILSTDVNSAGQVVSFPQNHGQVDVTIYEVPPGAILPVQKHIFPRMGYVLYGTLKVTIVDTRRTSVYVPGDFVLETVDEWHEGENVGAEPVKLLVIDLVEVGAENVVVRSNQDPVARTLPALPKFLQSCP